MKMEENQEKNLVSLNRISRKIEIRPLDHEQIASSLPDYEQLLDAVKRLREHSCPGEESYEMDAAQPPSMYNNILAIFGGRGSGKTSVLLTLRQDLIMGRRKKKERAGADIILPIISPELISDNSTMLSWVLAMFQSEIERIDQRLREHPDLFKQLEKQYGTGDCGLKSRQSFLRREYDDLMRESGSNRIFREMHRYEYEDLLRLQAMHAKEQYQLMNRLRKFWDMVIEVQRRLEPQESPLIFIMFDDIDLAPERSMELLMSAYKYFSNPHVVIVLSAAKKTLHQVLTYRMYEKVVGSDFSSLIQGNDIQGYRQEVRRNSYRMDRASEAAIEYLNKVIPQVNRYELNRFDTYDKKLTFHYPCKVEGTEIVPEERSVSLGNLMIQCMDAYQLTVNGKNFIKKGEKDGGKDQSGKDEMAREYYLLFGDKSRYITNACLGILNTCKELSNLKKCYENKQKMDNKYLHTLFYILRHCLSLLVSSHTRSMEECGGWISQLFRYEYGDHYLVVDYGFLLEKYRAGLREILESVARELAASREGMSEEAYWMRYNDCLSEKNIELKQRISVLFAMLFFVEHLVEAMEISNLTEDTQKSEHTQGLNALLAFLNESAVSDNSLTLFPEVESMEKAMGLYGELLEEMRFDHLVVTDGRQVEAYFSYLDDHSYFMEMLATEREKEERGLYHSCNQNPEWIQSICTMLYLTKSGIQIVHANYFDNLHLFFQDVSVLPALEKRIKRLEQEALKFITQWDILGYSERKLEELKGIHDEKRCEEKDEEDGETRSWLSLCQEILDDTGELYIYGLMNSGASEEGGGGSLVWQDISQESLAQVVCNRMERVVRECYRNMVGMNMGMMIARERVVDIQMLVENLCEVFPEAEPIGRAILLDLERQQKIEETVQLISLDATNALRFLLQCNTTYRLAMQQKDSNIVGAYYRSLMQDLSGLLKLEVTASQMSGVRTFLKTLKTVEEMIPYYFSARFILANASRYDELQLGQTKPTKGGETATKVYQDIIQVMKQQEYSVLRGFMVEIRARYTKELRSDFEVTA